jgi:hypothetical protein
MRDSVTRVLALTIVGSMAAGMVVAPASPLGATSRPDGESARPESVRTIASQTGASAAPALDTLPLSFEANVGQAPPDVRYFARIGQQRLLLTTGGAVLDLRTANTQAAPVMRTPGRHNPSPTEKGIARLAGSRQLAQKGMLHMEFVGGAPVAPDVEAKLPGVVHYYLGKDPKNWRTNVPTFGRVRYRDVYPGIDVVYYGKGGLRTGSAFEYDLVIAPGADPAQIRITFRGAEGQRLAPNGDLILTVDGREVHHRKPEIYQDIAGVRHPVAGRYVAAANGEIRFDVGTYVATVPLVIDPVTFIPLGNGGLGFPEKAVGDSNGNSYVTGFTSSVSNLPPSLPAGSRCIDFPDIATDAFLAKLDAQNALEWTVIVGGRDANGFNDCTGTFGLGLALDATASNVVFVGSTNTPNLVISDGTNVLATPPAFQQALGDDTCFLNSLVAGNPLYQSGGDGFVIKVTAAGALKYGTYLGGNLMDFATAVVLDAAGNAYVTGGTQSQLVTRPASCAGPAVPRFPAQYNTILNLSQAAGGFSDVFVAKLNLSGSIVNFMTLQGSSGDDAGIAIALNAQNEAVVTADTLSVLPLGGGLTVTPPVSPATTATVTMIVSNPRGPQTRFVLKRDTTVTLFDQTVPVGIVPTYQLSATGLADGPHTLELTITDPTGESITISSGFTVLNGAIAAVGTDDTRVATADAKGFEHAVRVASMFASTELPVAARLAGIEAGLAQATPPCPALPDGSTFRPSNYRGASKVLLGTPTVPYVSECDAENAVIAKFSTTSGVATAPPFLVGGSSDDSPIGVGVDSSNNVYIAGQTASPDFPTKNEITGTAGHPDPAKSRLGTGEAFISGFVMMLTLPAPASTTAPVQRYSSLLGGSGGTTVSGLAVTPAGDVFLSGVTTSTDPDVNVIPRAPDPDTATAYIVRIPAPATLTAPPVVTADNQLLSAPATSGATLAITVDVDGNVVVAGAPDDSGTLGIKLAATIKATIDVKPRAKKNVIHVRAQHVRVAILSTATFDAVERIDPARVTFGKTGDEESLLKCDKKGRKVNGDKLRDLICTFRVAKTNLGASDVAGVLKAKTKAGANVVGTDALTVVAKEKGEKDQDCDDDDAEWSDRDDD